MGLKPIGSKVAIDRAEVKTKSEGGIILPDIAQGKPLKGVVVAVGPGMLRDDGTHAPMQVKVGDRVVWPPYKGTEIEVGKKLSRFVVMDEDELLGIETDD